MIGWSLILIAAWSCILALGTAFAEQGKDPRGTHPARYTIVEEVQRHGGRARIQSTVSEIDDRSLISISFDETKMRKPENGKTQVKIRVEAFQTKDGDRDRIAPVDNYVSRQADEEGDSKISNFSYHDRPYAPDVPGERYRIPNTIIDPIRLLEKDVDEIEIRIINLKTRERVVFFLRLREFGFRTKLTDTFMFFKRPGTDPEKGIDTVNFSPAAGVTYGTTYLSRNNSGIKKFFQALRPGFGVNASILRWKDLTLDDMGRVSNGANGSNLNVGLGVQVSLFNNILMFSYGANLQAERNRWYYGIGISIIQLNGAISEGSP